MSLDRVGGRYSSEEPEPKRKAKPAKDEPKKKEPLFQRKRGDEPEPAGTEPQKRSGNRPADDYSDIFGRINGHPESRKPAESGAREAQPKPASTKASIDLNGPARTVPKEEPAPAPAAPAPEPEKKRRFGRKEEPVDDERLGTWADTGYSATDAEAHRDERYNGTSGVKRVAGIFMNQMKLFSKNKWTFILIFAAVLIPVIVVILPKDIADSLAASCGGSTQYIGMLLGLMPLMVSFFTAVLCGTQISREFKDRTAYMSIPLPVSRTEFYLGKFLAGFVLCLGAFLMAFGFATIMGMLRFDAFFSDIVADAFVLTAISIFAFSATAFCLGTFMRRGSSLVPLALMYIVLPAVFFYLYAKYDMGWAVNMPCFLPDAILSDLGSPLVASPMFMFSSMSPALGIEAPPYDMMTMVIIGLVWGVAFLAIGAFKMNRREM